ncbi:hypothetical protein [Comamonas koreensis]|uniref:Phage tail protein n=1 Tax=Comamonas koreensis TaxID=160825 RepID=A0AAW4Y3H1_9BURK|nr:hypothetical protein [Comamonas koreensis]MCD2168063.1 hypothetical protein [Comamonas koreensis]
MTFSSKAFALAASYETQRIAFNTALSQVYTNSQWAQEKALEAQNAAAAAGQSAAAAQASRQAADTAVQDVRAAMDAIQAGPVASVMGRTGVVTGLVERSGPIYTKAVSMADAPLGQWASFNDGTGAGADWPTTLAISCWNVFTFGTAVRKTQRATQVLDGAQQGWIFERQLHDTTWGPWHRIFTNRTLIESGRHLGAAAPSYTVDPSIATANWVEVFNAVTINVTNPRGFGDQLSILISMVNASPITFSSNVKLPVGGVPALSANTITTMALIARVDGVWNLHIGGANPW